MNRNFYHHVTILLTILLWLSQGVVAQPAPSPTTAPPQPKLAPQPAPAPRPTPTLKPAPAIKPAPQPTLVSRRGRLDFGGGLGKRVVLIPLIGAITDEMAEKTEALLTKAGEKRVALVVVQLDTLGGGFHAVERIRKALLRSTVPTLAFVDKQAVGLGAIIAYACELIAFSPGSSMGASGDLPPELARVRNLLRTAVQSTAEARGRDGRLALAMFDATVDFPQAPKGQLLTLTTQQALAAKVADLVSPTVTSLLASLKLDGARITRELKDVEPEREPLVPTTKPKSTIKPKKSHRKLDFGGGTGKTVYVISIKGEIEQGLAPYLIRVIGEAEKKGVHALLLHIDTPGGRVDSMNQMRKALLRTKIPTIAFVDKEAISAGSVIAYACKIIVFASAASMGAATPIQISGGKAKPVGEKIVSWMRAVIRSTAEANGRDGRIAEAMVDANVDLPPLAPKGKLLTITTPDALKYGVADLQAETIDEVLAKLNLKGAKVEHKQVNWAEKVGRFLTGSIMSSILMSLGGLALLIGLYTGSMTSLLIGVSCFALFFFGHYVSNLAGYEELILLLIGVILLVIEVAVIPGFGIVGVLGIVFILVALVLSGSGLDIPTQWKTQTLTDGLIRVAISVSVTALLMFVFARYFPQTRAGRRFVLETSLDAQAGFSTQDAAAVRFQGMRGVALTDLRPAGKALVDGEKLDVVSSSGFQAKGTEVEVIEVSASRIVVRGVRG